MWFTRMMVHSKIVFLLLVLASSETVARECEQDDGSSVIEMARCLSCTGCYNLVGLNYNATLEVHASLTNYHEYFLNISQLNFSQLLDQYEMMLMISNNLAMETSENERNLTFQLSFIANATIQATQLLDILNRNLSLAMNGSRTARTTHSNSEVVLGEINTLVNTIMDLVNHNITDLSHRTESFFDQIINTLDLLTDVAKDTSSMARQQENVIAVANSTAEKAHNISAMALAILCHAINIHNATSDTIRRLSSQDAVNVKTLQQQIDTLVTQIQVDISERDVFNTSEWLINQVENVTTGIPLYDVNLVESMVHDIVRNITELITNFNSSLDHLSDLKEQAASLNDTSEELLQTGREVKEDADVLFMTLNETFMNTMQIIKTAHLYFNNITVLHGDLTAVFHSFNKNISGVVKRLEQAENATEVANSLSVDGQEDLRHIRQLLNNTAQSLDNSANQLTDENATLTTAKGSAEGDKTNISNQVSRAEVIIQQTKVRLTNISKLNETSTEQSAQLKNGNLKVGEIEETLGMIKEEIKQAKENLTSLMESLEDLELVDTNTAEGKVMMANQTVERNNRLLNDVKAKMEELRVLSSELQDKYTQLKQHRDLLQKILDNVGETPCGQEPSP